MNKSKYNEDIHQRIVDAIGFGATRAMAAAAGGISERTLSNWMVRAKEQPDSNFGKLKKDIQEADGQAGVNALKTIKKAFENGDWKPAAWLLERKFGYRRDGVRELRQHAVLPGNLDQHEAEILAEVRRLRVDASQSGSYVSAATLMRMETEMLTQKRAQEKAEADKSNASASEKELLEIISSSVDGMPRSMLDELSSIIEQKRRRAS